MGERARVRSNSRGPGLLAVLAFLALVAPAGAHALLVCRADGFAERVRLELAAHPSGTPGLVQLADSAGAVASTRNPLRAYGPSPAGASARERASEEAEVENVASALALTASVALRRFQSALPIWLIGALLVASAVFSAMARRSRSLAEPTWSSPLHAWVAKRGLALSLLLVLCSPALLLTLEPAVASSITLALAVPASVWAYWFVENLPARL